MFSWFKKNPKRVVAIPSRPTLYRFVCRKDFYSKELKSQYVGGLTYQVRDGDEVLSKLVPEWETKGLVRRL